MDRLLFASELAWFGGSRIYVSGLCDRLAGRGLVGRTLAPLISLADRLAGNHSGHQIPGALIDPFHAVSQSRTGSGSGLDCADLVLVGVEGPAVVQDTPGDARQFVGERCCKLVAVEP